MKNKLFAEFEPVSSKQWKQKIQYELQGADYNKTLVHESPEGIKTKPFYHHDEVQEILKINIPSHFKICETIYIFNLEKTIEKTLKAIQNGAESIQYNIDNLNLDISELLNKIPSHITIYINFSFFDEDYLKKIDVVAQQKNTIYYCNIDPIGNLAKDGNWYKTHKKNNFEAIKSVLKVTRNISLISINAQLYENAGANMVQQIAYTLTHANEYFNLIDKIKYPVLIHISVGSNYFFEIAKLRAMRFLFDLIAKEYDANYECHLVVSPTIRNKTIYNATENSDKTNTECESAILGGANTVYNIAYDSLYKKSNYKSVSLAQKQLTILKQNYNATMTQGSYYVENLTHELAQKALELFKKIEKNGGFLKLLNEGIITQKIEESAIKEQKIFDLNHKIETAEKIKNQIELYPFLKINPRKTIIKPIIPKRLWENMEKIKLDLE